MKHSKISEKIEQELLDSYEKLYRLAFSYVRNEQDAMDVVQESAYKAMKNASQVKDPSYIRTWIWRITMNTAVDVTRRQLRYVGGIQMPEEGREDRYEDTDLAAALDALEEKERQVIVLKYFEEWTIKDIAACLQISPNTVKSILYRSLKKLKLEVEEDR